MADFITVTLKLFSAYQEAYGVSEQTRQLSPETTVEQLLNLIVSEHPELEFLKPITRFGVNLDFVEADTLLKDGDEVVLIPPVSGG